MALTTNLVSYYKFDENTGTSVGDAIGTNTGTWNGTVGSQWTPGRINSGGSFNGTNNYVNVPDSSSLDAISTACSVQVWAYLTTVNVNNQFISKRSAFTATGIPFELTSTGSPAKASWRVIGNGNQCTGATTLLANTWYHIVGTWNGTTMTLYLNNVVDHSQGASGTITTNSTAVNIGAYPSGNELFTGILDEVAIWSRALSVAEVTQLYNGGAGLQYPFTVSGLFYKHQTAVEALSRKTGNSSYRLADQKAILYGGIAKRGDEISYLKGKNADAPNVNRFASDAWLTFAEANGAGTSNRADQAEREFYKQGNYP